MGKGARAARNQSTAAPPGRRDQSESEGARAEKKLNRPRPVEGEGIDLHMVIYVNV